MTEQATPLSVIQHNGRAWLSVSDLVGALRSMAAATEGGQQSAHDALTMLADTFAQAVEGDEAMYAAPPPPMEPCPQCARGVHVCDRLKDGTIVLDAQASQFGRWLIVVGSSGRQLAVRYDAGKHARIGDLPRFREHACAVLS